MLLGTDVLERIFGNMRLKYGHNGFDHLEMLYCTRASKEVMDILDRHPEWTKKNHKFMKRLSLDYSSSANWNCEELILRDIDIKSCWDHGRRCLEIFIENSYYYSQ